MNCWHCGTELIWGGDHSIDEEDFPLEYDYIIYKQKDENNEVIKKYNIDPNKPNPIKV